MTGSCSCSLDGAPGSCPSCRGVHELPAEIVVGPFRYRVTSDRAEMNAVCRTQKADLLGHCDSRSLTILVDPDQAAGQAADTLLHEVLHAVFNLTGLDAEWDEDHAEVVVRRTSPVLLEVLRGNPGLVAFLVDPTFGDRSVDVTSVGTLDGGVTPR